MVVELHCRWPPTEGTLRLLAANADVSATAARYYGRTALQAADEDMVGIY